MPKPKPARSAAATNRHISAAAKSLSAVNFAHAALSFSIYTVLFLLYLAVFMFTGFFLHISINHWTLSAAFASYVMFGTVYLLVSGAPRQKLTALLISAAIIPLLFWGLSGLFGATYDTSFDGQGYHQSAIIALAEGWNPVYRTEPPAHFQTALNKTLDEGSPKIIWSIDASIYKLTGHIDSATSLNLIIGLLALSFSYCALENLGLRGKLPLVLATLAVVTVLYVEQFFSFREDGISYELLLIGIASLLLVRQAKQKLPYFLCLIATFIFLAGSKYSNLFGFSALLLLALYVCLRHRFYRLAAFRLALGLGLACGCITLFNPYITNIEHYHAIDYPYNQPAFADSLRKIGTPANIRRDNRLQLFYYGVFAATELSVDQDFSYQAHLKLPFTFSDNEVLDEAGVVSKTVGGYGVLFSGIFVLSAVGYLYLAVGHKGEREKTVFRWLSAACGLIIGSCLASPAPNSARYLSQLSLLPIAVVVALLLSAKYPRRPAKLLALVLIAASWGNILLDALPASALDSGAFDAINAQLLELRHSGQTYVVHADAFDSNYSLLAKHGVKIRRSPQTIQCPRQIFLAYSSNSTTLCQSGDFKTLNHRPR